MSNAFTADAGLYQGRCRPVGPGLEGVFVYELGHQLPGIVRSVAAGASHAIAQTWNLDDATFVRARARLRPPSSMPAGVTWRFSATIDGHEYGARVIEREALVVDLALPALPYGGGGLEVIFQLVLDGPNGLYDVELPGCAIDAVVTDGSLTTPVLINRVPEPDETAVSTGAAIVVQVQDAAAVGVDLATVQVTVQGLLAYDGATDTVQPGWAGAGAGAVLTADNCGYIVTLVPTTPLAPLTLYAVGVEAATTGGAALSTSYTWMTEDTIAPAVVEAVGIARQRVRVRFDEQVLMTAGSALAVDHYAIALVSGAPAVPLEVVSVERESATAVVLVLDIAQTPRAIYRVTVTGVTDLLGNVVDPSANTGLFSGFAPAVPAGRDISLFKMLPEVNQAEDTTGEHERFLGVMQEVADLVYGLIDEWTQILDYTVAPEPWVDLILADLGNPFAFLNFSLTQKRKLCGLLLEVYRTKGTGPGIVEACNVLLGVTVQIQVYAWAPFGLDFVHLDTTFVLGTSTQRDLYTFLVVSPVVLSDDQRRAVRAIASYMKAAHEHFRIVEPAPVVVVDHWQLGYSTLDYQTALH